MRFLAGLTVKIILELLPSFFLWSFSFVPVY